MVTIQTPVRARYWKKYKTIVLIPRREERRKQLVSQLQTALHAKSLSELSGSILFGKLRVSVMGEPIEFEVATKVYTWIIAKAGGEAGLELVFVIVGDNCLECMTRVLGMVNSFCEVKGILELSIPGGEND